MQFDLNRGVDFIVARSMRVTVPVAAIPRSSTTT